MKKLKLASQEIAELAANDAENFGISASVQKDGDDFFVEYSQVKASYGEEKEDEEEDEANEKEYYKYKAAIQDFEWVLKWMKEDMEYTRKAFYQHLEGHLPPIKDVAKLQNAIDILGLGDSFEVAKKTIYVEY